MVEIHPHGYWMGDTTGEHYYDMGLASCLVQFFHTRQGATVVDFGCGDGVYVRQLRAAGIECDGYDGNPVTKERSGGICQTLDLVEPQQLPIYSWVISIEVGEHIPSNYEFHYIENLHRHNSQGIIMSWAVRGQNGLGHVNCRDNHEVKKLMSLLGYRSNEEQEKRFREAAVFHYLKNTLMVFNKGLF